MLPTVGDVKNVARKLWPDATEVSVYITAASGETPKRYHVSAFNRRQSLLGRLTADDLSGLIVQLQRRRAKVA